MAQLKYGAALMELLKQPLCHPMSMSEQVITLVLASNHVMDDVQTADIKKFQADILEYFNRSHSEVISEIEQTKALTDETKQKILDIAAEYKSRA
jgi:F-type H+-transporting ATPase subunit alpha